MVDSRTPVDLRSRIGAYTKTKVMDDQRGLFVYENTNSGTHHLYIRIGTRWIWCLKATSTPELLGLAHILKSMGVEYAPEDRPGATGNREDDEAARDGGGVPGKRD